MPPPRGLWWLDRLSPTEHLRLLLATLSTDRDRPNLSYHKTFTPPPLLGLFNGFVVLSGSSVLVFFTDLFIVNSCVRSSWLMSVFEPQAILGKI